MNWINPLEKKAKSVYNKWQSLSPLGGGQTSHN
jgi:hypothetical protein